MLRVHFSYVHDLAQNYQLWWLKCGVKLTVENKSITVFTLNFAARHFDIIQCKSSDHKSRLAYLRGTTPVYSHI